jgi:hypothetical protein
LDVSRNGYRLYHGVMPWILERIVGAGLKPAPTPGCPYPPRINEDIRGFRTGTETNLNALARISNHDYLEGRLLNIYDTR